MLLLLHYTPSHLRKNEKNEKTTLREWSLLITPRHSSQACRKVTEPSAGQPHMQLDAVLYDNRKPYGECPLHSYKTPLSATGNAMTPPLWGVPPHEREAQLP